MKRFTLAATIIFLLAFIVSCGQQSDSKIYETTSKDKWSTITIEVKWVSEQQIDSFCKRLGTNDGGSGATYRGCARSKSSDVRICEVYAVRPRDFDDRDRLIHFGHEVWHCLGATHD